MNQVIVYHNLSTVYSGYTAESGADAIRALLSQIMEATNTSKFVGISHQSNSVIYKLFLDDEEYQVTVISS